MARTRAIDVLFEFDAPQTFRDLSAPFSPVAPGEHDVWFDQIHPQHSKPSADLAREAAGVVRKLQEKEQQLKDVESKNKIKRWSGGKENHLRPSTGDYGQTRQKQLKLRERKKHASLEEMRATDEPFQIHLETTKEGFGLERRRKPLGDARNRLNFSGRERTLPSSEKKAMRDWQELLKRHNKKFKAVHTYEPPQHSVREVKQWEREMKKTYYALSAEERAQANEEIAVWKQRQVDRSH
ncbi:unnamed protein product [Peronospora destructor]|uniref:Uncharacterized protein n=1 Tax=Peronospora destructor TaxID=86335 RepID=A0AAV0TFQ0_9STRA|nr:unnamed protein product [Peronospora destructor]